MKIGLISDTHGYMDDRIVHHLSGCDHIIHAGDVGNMAVIDRLAPLATLSCVYGNIDGTAIRSQFPESLLLSLEGIRALVIHIAGPFEKYNAKVRALIEEHAPEVLICGHSHILKIARDKRFNLTYMNPGAAGNQGFHKMRTLCRFEAAAGTIKNLEIIELGPRSAQAIH